jgi:hypothetical protein
MTDNGSSDQLRDMALYSYELDSRRQNMILSVVAVAVTALIGGLTLSSWFFLLFIIPVVIVIQLVRSGNSRPLLVARRYLILGERIVYYRNILRAVIDHREQTLTLSSERSQPLVIAADKFPTNARKPDKIKANRNRKFNDVAARVSGRLREASVEVTVIGSPKP